MSIELTQNQQAALDHDAERPTRVVDPRSNAGYVLVPEKDYEVIREWAEEAAHERELHDMALRNAAARMDEAS